MPALRMMRCRAASRHRCLRVQGVLLQRPGRMLEQQLHSTALRSWKTRTRLFCQDMICARFDACTRETSLYASCTPRCRNPLHAYKMLRLPPADVLQRSVRVLAHAGMLWGAGHAARLARFRACHRRSLRSALCHKPWSFCKTHGIHAYNAWRAAYTATTRNGACYGPLAKSRGSLAQR